MNYIDKTVILLMSDLMVLKGLQLLLEDMGFQVISSHHVGDLLALASKLPHNPGLIILPFEFDKDKTGNELIRQLRDIFRQAIPAMLLSPESAVSQSYDEQEGVLVLSEQIKPKDLRNKISALVGKELAL